MCRNQILQNHSFPITIRLNVTINDNFPIIDIFYYLLDIFQIRQANDTVYGIPTDKIHNQIFYLKSISVVIDTIIFFSTILDGYRLLFVEDCHLVPRKYYSAPSLRVTMRLNRVCLEFQVSFKNSGPTNSSTSTVDTILGLGVLNLSMVLTGVRIFDCKHWFWTLHLNEFCSSVVFSADRPCCKFVSVVVSTSVSSFLLELAFILCNRCTCCCFSDT